MILLDSSILIDLFRATEKEKTAFYRLSVNNQDFSISVITYYEIGVGNRKSHGSYWESLCENLSILPFDKACSDCAINIYRDLLKKNKMIDLADILIGATSLAHQIPLATLNNKHFNRIKGIETISV